MTQQNNTIDIDVRKVRRENMRWVLLLAGYNSRPIRAAEHLLLAVVQGIYPDVTQQELRRELGYIEGHDLVEITRQHDNKWFMSLTHRGVDVVEYNDACPPGIARPEKYWT